MPWLYGHSFEVNNLLKAKTWSRSRSISRLDFSAVCFVITRCQAWTLSHFEYFILQTKIMKFCTSKPHNVRNNESSKNFLNFVVTPTTIAQHCYNIVDQYAEHLFLSDGNALRSSYPTKNIHPLSLISGAKKSNSLEPMKLI